jgi:hypothetical protein
MEEFSEGSLRRAPQAFAHLGDGQRARPTLMIEVKTSDRELAPGLVFFHDRYAIPGVQLVGDLRVESEHKGLAILRALDWLKQLERPTR